MDSRASDGKADIVGNYRNLQNNLLESTKPDVNVKSATATSFFEVVHTCSGCDHRRTLRSKRM